MAENRGALRKSSSGTVRLPSNPDFFFVVLILFSLLAFARTTHGAEARWLLWQDAKPRCELVLPTSDERAARLAQSTLSHFLKDFYQIELSIGQKIDVGWTYLVLGKPEN